MINSLFTFWPVKYARKNMQEKQLLHLGYDRIFIEKVVGDS